ncbi:TaqI-like C-terminal specificity domain-containing protein [uncultured Treponema sp.]|mgnify:FL=1|uniref:TaqI-like C-terminal specificity domain-containing protein n=1 Tax=uncultured Treponema sp. TaxID=162155 RepID=UPI00258A72C1|nr:TaqI-like C-terminal specificity domain-containing protein [uncultured Treponema sp.]
MSDFVKQNSCISNFDTSNSWVILSPIEQSIKSKIEKIGTPLKDWDINIYRGVLTGFNDAFIISGEKRDEILANCKNEIERKKTAELIRPILRGRDIKRYEYNFADLYLINTHNGVKDKNIPRIDIKDYPAIKNHLDEYWDKISTRADKGDTPYNLRNCAYMDEFNKPKIVWGNLNLSATYTLAPAGMMINAPATMIVPASESLLCILNSKIADYYIRNLGVTRNGGYFEYKPMFIEQLPVPQNIDEKLFEEFSNKELNNEEEIDRKVYELYGLTDEEIQFLEKM